MARRSSCRLECELWSPLPFDCRHLEKLTFAYAQRPQMHIKRFLDSGPVDMSVCLHLFPLSPISHVALLLHVPRPPELPPSQPSLITSVQTCLLSCISFNPK